MRWAYFKGYLLFSPPTNFVAPEFSELNRVLKIPNFASIAVKIGIIEAKPPVAPTKPTIASAAVASPVPISMIAFVIPLLTIVTDSVCHAD